MAFAALAFAASAPPLVTIGLALVAGAAPAANAGGLRALLVELAGEKGSVRALGVETTLTQGIWAAAPAAVAFLALGVVPGAPLGLAAVSALAFDDPPSGMQDLVTQCFGSALARSPSRARSRSQASRSQAIDAAWPWRY